MNEYEFFEEMKFKVVRDAWMPFQISNYYNFEVYTDHRIYYVETGAIEWVMNGEKYISTPNSLILVPSNTPVNFSQIEKKSYLAYFSFIATYHNNSIFDYIDCPKQVYFDDMTYIKYLFKIAEPNHDNPVIGEVIRSNSIVQQILSQYLIQGRAVFRDKPLSNNTIINKIIKYVDVHPRETYTLELFSQLTHVHPSYISRIFKDELGVSPIKYANALKLRKILDMLRNSSCTVAFLSDQFGFNSPEAFSRFIKQHTTMSPTEYRKYANKSEQINIVMDK